MRSKIKIIFVVYFCLLLISACCDSNIYIIKITDIEFRPLNSFVQENENFEFRLFSNDSIVGVALNYPEFKIIQSAHAYGCKDEVFLKPIATVKEMKIKVLTNFSDEHQSNDYITELIDVRFYNWRTQNSETKSLEEFFYLLNQDDQRTERYADLNFATFILSQRPTLSNEQEFEIEFIFTDESILTTLTETIIWE